MYYFLLGLLILDALLLIPVVLLQAGKGGGLAAMGGGAAGTDTLFGGRQAATLLTRATWWCGGAFLVLALALSVMASGRGVEGRTSIIRGGETPVTTAPALPGAQPEAAAPQGGTSPVGAPFEQQGPTPQP